MKYTRQLWCIQERFTGGWCTSSKLSHFGKFDEAVLFVSEANAKKAVKEMNLSLERGNLGNGLAIRAFDKYVMFTESENVMEFVNNGYVIAHAPRPEYVVVECTLTT